MYPLDGFAGTHVALRHACSGGVATAQHLWRLAPAFAATAMVAGLLVQQARAVPISIAQHDAVAESQNPAFGRDIEFFGVTDEIEFHGRADHDMKIAGAPAGHAVHPLKVGDKVGFQTRLEFGARRIGTENDGRPLFVPTGEQRIVPFGADLTQLTPDLRALRIRNHDALFGRGMAAGVFDYSMPWSIDVVDGIETVTETVSIPIMLGAGGSGVGATIQTTTIKTSPTRVTRAIGGPDLFEFELTKPQGTDDFSQDAAQGFFDDGGTLVVNGFIRATKPGMGIVWFDNWTEISFDQIFETQDPNPGLGTDEAMLGNMFIYDMGLREQIRTVPWDKYQVVPEPSTALLLGAALAWLGLRSGRRRPL